MPQEIRSSGPWLGFHGFAIGCREYIRRLGFLQTSTDFEAGGSEISLGSDVVVSPAVLISYYAMDHKFSSIYGLKAL